MYKLFAILETGGKQFKVSPGDVIKVERIPGERSEAYVFDKVLAVNLDGATKFGSPYLTGVTVRGTVLRQGRAKKILVFKYRAKSNYRRRIGHRQAFTEVKIESIDQDGQGKATA